jgi:lambda repressor-like predicted transcriptional regulator
MKTTIELPNMRKVLAELLKKQGSSMRTLSLKMGRTSNYLTLAFESRSPRIGLLIEVSNMTGINLFDIYLGLLDPGVPGTSKEVVLQDKIDALTKELEATKAERDKYWEVIARR